eukprot:TRINITY_DN94292_c0_g1_i1.p1 TRINITY_DN94292_c0_g1~~TRINITY_DN94292_c0_g1_i1.p1  ORF type:complete len:336 (-),score=64.66 TRINITY_DN94292_c0_g1_i1:191-1198(-)
MPPPAATAAGTQEEEDALDAPPPPQDEDAPLTGGSGSPPPELEDLVSKQLLCPISLRIMELPLITPSGHTYDSKSISEWLARRPVDPLNFQPLGASSLCPNRAIHDEVVEQLIKIADKAEAFGDEALLRAAKNKLEKVREAKAGAQARTATSIEVGILDIVATRCASVANWAWLLFLEQVLIFSTSFGALGCLLIDIRALGIAKFLGLSLGPPSEPLRAPPLLATFMRLAWFPYLEPPKHWRWLGRFTLNALRYMLLVPLGPICSSLAIGSLASLARFGQRCVQVRAIEQERAAQNRWFSWTIQACGVVTGITSFGLFLRLFWDRRAAMQQSLQK